jgi:aminoglycoside phosphotransferase (APT) family kinase protein
VKSLTEDLKQAALEALNILSDGNNLCHGDYHPDNIQMSPQGPVIIDWNDATRGVPEADIARTLLLLQKGQLPSHLRFDVEETQSIRARFVNAYMRKYSTTRSISMEEVESWQLPVMAARLSEGMKKKRVIS